MWQPKLCDFGLAKLREDTVLQTTLRGVSPIWASPEMFDDKVAGGVTEKADIYSFGIITFELATRKLPYSGISNMQLPQLKMKGQLPVFPDVMDSKLEALTKWCLMQKPKARPSMQDILSRIQEIATARAFDLQAEQKRMEQH